MKVPHFAGIAQYYCEISIVTNARKKRQAMDQTDLIQIVS